MASTRRPVAVDRALAQVGSHVRDWRRLAGVTQALLAERAGVSEQTLRSLESGRPVGTDTLAKVLRALGALDLLTGALDPMATDVGRLRADQHLPERVRMPRNPS